MNLPIIKCHGSGNDFVLIDETDGELFTEIQRPRLARLLCDRRRIIGADGVLFAQKSLRADIRMRMFNADGSEPQTCGNGLRCIARFGAEKFGMSSLYIETMKGVSAATAERDLTPGVSTFSVELGPISTETKDIPLVIEYRTLVNSKLDALSDTLLFSAISAPNPHLIAIVNRININELKTLGSRVLELPDILPEGANLSFAQIIDDESLAVATFERGSGLTLSCGSAMGTSTLAACIAGHVSFGKWVSVFNRGGFVKAQAINEGNDTYRVLLQGNATYVFRATIPIDADHMVLENSFSGEACEDETSAYENILRTGERVMSDLDNGREPII